jgi:anti-sigma regulatory factor (Ser/Thr protein kinase)
VEGIPLHPIVRAAYPADRTAVARARRFVRETLIGWGADDAMDDAVLLTSELATNAVIHARTPFEVICRSAGGTVQVEVVDGDGSHVLPAPARGDDPDRTCGRGLLMPVMLAPEWGVSYAATSKTVWFRLDTRRRSRCGMPDIPGVEYGMVEGPACGDLYDVFEAAPGRWRFALGDVRGTGPEAATITDLARHGLRLLAAEGHGVAAVVTRVNRAIVREGVRGRPLRLLHGELVLRPDAGVRLTLVSAGHPAPLRLTPGEEAVPVAGTQPALGWSYDAGFEEETTDLGPGDALLCVTGGTVDGVPRRDDLPGPFGGGPGGGLGGGLGVEAAGRLGRAPGDAAALLVRVL